MQKNRKPLISKNKSNTGKSKTKNKILEKLDTPNAP